MAIANDGAFDRELHVALGVAESVALKLGDGEWSARFEYGDAARMGRVRRLLESIEAELHGEPTEPPFQLVEESRTATAAESAADALEIKAGLCGQLLEAIDIALAEHREKAAATPGDWGYVGDVARCAGQLAEALLCVANVA